MESCARLDHLHDESDPQRRRLIALGLLTKQLALHGIEPILVGGGALEFYTAGGYVRERTSKIPEEAEALGKVEREAQPS